MSTLSYIFDMATFKEFFSWRRRDREMYELLKQDEISSHDIISAEYGRYPVAENARSADLKQLEVLIEDYFSYADTGGFTNYAASKFKTYFINAYVVPSENNEPHTPGILHIKNSRFNVFSKTAFIALVPFLFSSELSQLANGQFPSLKLTTLGFIAFCAVRYRELPGVLAAPFESKSDTVGHEHIHILQVKDFQDVYKIINNPFAERIFRLRGDTENFSWIDRIRATAALKYLLQDREIQARLHVLMVKDCNNNQRDLPQTREEFWGRLVAYGLKAPPGIKNTLSESDEFSLHRTMRRAFDYDVSQLNMINTALDENERLFFWEEALPYIYGHLLELYGDVQGRQKMGYSNNIAANDKALFIPLRNDGGAYLLEEEKTQSLIPLELIRVSGQDTPIVSI